MIPVWDIATGQCMHTLMGHNNSVTSTAITTDNTKVVSSSYDNTIKIWDMTTGHCLKTLQSLKTANDVLIADNNSKIIAVAKDPAIAVWDLNTGACLYTLTGHTKSILQAIVIKQAGKIASVSQDRTIKIWDINTGECLQTITLDHCSAYDQLITQKNHIAYGPNIYQFENFQTIVDAMPNC